jgi:hypothetical protein
MSAKVRELIDDLVWSNRRFANISNEVNKILKSHVLSMLLPACVIGELHCWAAEQRDIHDAKALKIQTMLVGMHTLDCTGVTKLRDHHMQIAKNYQTVSTEIFLFNIER